MRGLRQMNLSELRGARVLLRVDLDIDLDGGQVSRTHPRFQAALTSIRTLQRSGARTLVLAHRGRPDGVDPALSLQPIARALAEELESGSVRFCAMQDPASLQKETHATAAGDVCVLENVRFHPGERANDPEFAKQLASLGDVYVCDAFGNLHRDHASMTGIPQHIPAYVGPHIIKELDALEPVIRVDKHPFVVVIGGAKLSSKLAAVQALLKKADHLFVGGAIATVFYVAQGKSVGTSFYYEEEVEHAAALLAHPTLRLPSEFVVRNASGHLRSVHIDAIRDDEAIVDLAPSSVQTIRSSVQTGQLLLWNGPVGIVEDPQTRVGTDAIAHVVAEVSRGSVYGVVGGGDTIAIPYELGIADFIDHISTGGGAMLQYVGEMTLPGLDVLMV